MRWCVIRLDGVGPSAIPESAWPTYRERGCVRVSEWMDDASQINLVDYTGAPAIEPEPEPARKPAATTSKEK